MRKQRGAFPASKQPEDYFFPLASRFHFTWSLRAISNTKVSRASAFCLRQGARTCTAFFLALSPLLAGLCFVSFHSNRTAEKRPFHHLTSSPLSHPTTQHRASPLHPTPQNEATSQMSESEGEASAATSIAPSSMPQDLQSLPPPSPSHQTEPDVVVSVNVGGQSFTTTR